jgi:hypothetical protein
MSRGFAVDEESPVTVRELDPPAEIEVGLKVHVAPPQDSAMGLKNVLGPEAEMEKFAVWVPTRRILERWFEESAKTGLPVPASLRAVVAFTAFEVILTPPVTLPVLAGVKLTEMEQVCPTFKDAGTVGRLGAQVFVSPKLPVAPMLVMVTA